MQALVEFLYRDIGFVLFSVASIGGAEDVHISDLRIPSGDDEIFLSTLQAGADDEPGKALSQEADASCFPAEDIFLARLRGGK